MVVTDEAQHEAALQQVREAEALQVGVVPSLGRAFAADTAIFAMLSRYETSIERGLFRTLHELQRLQATRMSQPPSEPVGADLQADLSIAEDFPTAADKIATDEMRIHNGLTQDGEN